MPDAPGLPLDPVAEAGRQWEVHGWGDVAPAMAVVTSIMRAQQLLLGRANAVLRPFGLTFARYELLMLLRFSRTGRLPLGKVGQRLQVNPGSITSAVDRLEGDGLVERVANPQDRRGTLAVLTPTGRRLADRATRAVNAKLFADLGLSDHELDAVFAGLRTLRRNADGFP